MNVGAPKTWASIASCVEVAWVARFCSAAPSERSLCKRLPDRGERIGIGYVAILGPHRAHERAGELQAGVRALLERRENPFGGKVGGNGKEFRLQIERKAQKPAPSLQLEEAVGLSLRGALLERQTA